MSKTRNSERATDRARPLDRQKVHEIQAFNQVIKLPAPKSVTPFSVSKSAPEVSLR